MRFEVRPFIPPPPSTEGRVVKWAEGLCTQLSRIFANNAIAFNRFFTRGVDEDMKLGKVGIELEDMAGAEPATPGVGILVLYAVKVAGKMRLRVKFPGGTTVDIAIEL